MEKNLEKIVKEIIQVCSKETAKNMLTEVQKMEYLSKGYNNAVADIKKVFLENINKF